jgi:P27 family predicted phage terminase small subunit
VPTAVLKLRGTARKDRTRHEPEPPDGMPRCPAWLDRQAKSAWKQLVPQLKQMRVLSRIDRNALVRYCQFWSRWKKAEEFLQKHGDVYPLKDEFGKLKCLQQFPQVAISHKLGAALGRLEQEFGLTPSARSRIQVLPQEDEPDPFKEFLHVAG